MKRILFVLIMTIIATAIGLYNRPTYDLIGQLDWFHVLTKGYFAGSIKKIFAQHLYDESFYALLPYTIGGFLGAVGMSSIFKKAKS